MLITLRICIILKTVLRRMFGPKGERLTERCKNCIMRSVIMITLSIIMKVIKSRKKRWADDVACMEDMRNS